MPSYRSQNKTKPTNIKKGISFFTVLFGIAIGYTKDVSQRMRNIFDILLQSMFEIAKSVFLENAAIIFTTSSGALVPNATTVKPITSDDIPNFFATLEPPSTSISAHFISKTNQIIINRKFIN